MPINKSDAIIILEGDGDNRIEHACNLYKQKYASNLVFSGNILNKDYGSYPLNLLFDKFKQYDVFEKDIIWENKSTNTKEQAQQIIKLCLENNWENIILVASNYHQYRAYLTFIKELYNANLNNTIKIYNSPCNLSWFEKNRWGIRYELLFNEFKKINIYQNKGDICSYKEALIYIKWIEQHQIYPKSD
jgi:uncharacterized SAM-binding protein YcdF (DUF218 family)